MLSAVMPLMHLMSFGFLHKLYFVICMYVIYKGVGLILLNVSHVKCLA